MHGYLYLYSLMVSAILSLVPALAGYLEPAAVAPQPETITRTLAWTAGQRHNFELSNINGSVRILAEDRSDVSVVATRTVEREGRNGEPTPTVDFRQQSDRLLVCGDNTRCGCRSGDQSDSVRQSGRWPANDRARREDRAEVRVDFEVRVPRAATLNVCTVNGATLRVDGTEGPFTLSNVNGNLEVVKARGTGTAHTVNGSIEASFLTQPAGPADLETVNGSIDATFPEALSADLRLTTMHGSLYTDFDTTLLPKTPVPERSNGRSTYRFDRAASVRVGGGGPALSFKTLNGDIRVRKQRQ